MTIMFMTKFKDGSFTNFVPKICKSLDPQFNEKRDLTEMMTSGKVLPHVFPKHHTIRSGTAKHVKTGTKLSLRIWKGLPYRSPQEEFANAECTGKHKIHIWQDHFGGRHVVINEKMLGTEEIERLAINDGFDNVNQFFSWFGWEFEGVIIHWTDINY